MKPILLELTPKEGRTIDFSKFIVQCSNQPSCVDLSDYHVGYVQESPIDRYRNEFLDYLRSFGLHSYLRRGPLNEAIIRPGETRATIVDFLALYLESLQIDSELIIVDRYIFPNRQMPAGYDDLLVSLLSPFLDKLKSVIVVTSPDHNRPLAEAVETKLTQASKTIQLAIRISDQWHDRFWITNKRSKGIFVGTSLNGLGRRYACVDVLDETDVTDIISGLISEEAIQ